MRKNLIKKLMKPSDVGRYFPSNIAEIFELKDSQIDYFGIKIEEEIECGSKPGFSQDLYMIFLGYNLAKNMRDLKFSDSAEELLNEEYKRLMRAEDVFFKEMTTQYYSKLSSKTPLLVLRLKSRIQKSLPLIFTERERYADHKMFRGRGIAKYILDSLENQLSLEGMKYLYGKNYSSYWYEKANCIPMEFTSDNIKSEILNALHDGLFYGKFIKTVRRQGYLRIFDKKKHAKEYKKAMKRIKN